MRNPISQAGKSRGVALVIVLWLLVLATITVGSFSILARTENLQAHQVQSGTKARYAAEAGISLAVMRLRDRGAETPWVPDGRVYKTEFAQAQLEISIIDERGKVDINGADELVLGNLFIAQGLDEDQVLSLVDAILDWRDADDLERFNGAEERDYESAGLSYGPANAPFQVVEELQQVLGMTYPIYQKVEPAITVSGQSTSVSPVYAPYEALLTLPGMTEELARDFIHQRENSDPLNPIPLLLPNGQEVLAGGGVGSTHTIKVKATMPNGIWEQLEATISFARRGNKPYQVIRWREGVSS